MATNPNNTNDLHDEFHTLGRNLVEALRAAWDSPERQALQQEIQKELAELLATLRKETNSFQESQTGQRLKSELDDLRQRIHSGEAESVAREEILKALRLINSELEKAATHRKASQPAGADASQEKDQA